MPRRFPIVQFPNRSLMLAAAAAVLARLSDGPARRWADVASRLATIFWATQEVVHGANWFRRLLGLGSAARACRALARSLAR